MLHEIIQTEEFRKWFSKESQLSQLKILARFDRIVAYGHFGSLRWLDENLFELKWRSGRRIYFSFMQDKIVLLLFGGKKNDQKKDIKKAKKIKEKYLGSK